MAFRIKPSKQLQVEADRIEATLLMPRYWRMTWTTESLRNELENTQHLVYTLEEMQRINDELHTRGVVEDI